MKKKIIGIILTLTMVLTMLPALALPTKAEDNTLTIYESDGVTEASPEGDYNISQNTDTGFTTVEILKSGLVIKGTLYDGTIELGEEVESVTLDGVKILPEKNNQIEFGIKALGDAVEIKLINDNQIGDRIIENESLDEGKVVLCGIDSQDLTFKGDGNLKIYGQIKGIDASHIADVGHKNITFDKTFEGTITIEHMGKDDGMNGAIVTYGDVILSGGTIKITSYNYIGIIAMNNIIVENTIKQAEIYGSCEIENVKIGALISMGKGEKPIDVSNDLLVLGEENAGPTFKTEDIKGTVELVKEEIDEESFYVYKVKGVEVAKALVIKQPSTPTNPETEDTRAMLIWEFAGLFALAVAVGILVLRKQKGKN